MGLIDINLIETIITPRHKDLGGFSVRRILPHTTRQMVGPFIFLDHMGPANFEHGHGIDVRPHPHIGLSTITYLFEGEIFHRDSIGSAQTILPGDVNWMTAGRGITHSERTSQARRSKPHVAHGLQTWVALPQEFEEIEPEFHHYQSGVLPEFLIGDVSLKLIAGKAFGHEAPVKTYSPLFYLEVKMPSATTLTLSNDYEDRSLYLISGQLKIGNAIIDPQTMPIFTKNEPILLQAQQPCHLMLLGGQPLPEQRFIDWNFVSSSKERLEQAKIDWANGNFPKVPGDAVEFIPLPS